MLGNAPLAWEEQRFAWGFSWPAPVVARLAIAAALMSSGPGSGVSLLVAHRQRDH